MLGSPPTLFEDASKHQGCGAIVYDVQSKEYLCGNGYGYGNSSRRSRRWC